ncbi:MAG: hypothetical protein HOO06_15045 [Bdellovibrionaceae bacterium]|jgi:hypothetical protein|nr:hypothetical protein [Pseudobdellovibrionaceae bacterium]
MFRKVLLIPLFVVSIFNVQAIAKNYSPSDTEMFSVNYDRFSKNGKFACNEWYGMQDASADNYQLVRECLQDYGQSLLVEGSGSEADQLVTRMLEYFSFDFTTSFFGEPMEKRYQFRFDDRVEGLAEGVINGGACLTNATFGFPDRQLNSAEKLLLKDYINMFKSQIDVYSRLAAVMHGKTLGKEMGLLLHIRSIVLCDQRSLLDGADGLRDMVITDGKLYSSLSIHRVKKFDLDYLLIKWRDGEVIRHILETTGIKKYVLDNDIFVPPVAIKDIPGTKLLMDLFTTSDFRLGLASPSDIRMLVMKEQSDYIGIGFEKLVPYWPLFDYGGAIRTHLRKKILRALNKDFLIVNENIYNAREVDGPSAVQDIRSIQFVKMSKSINNRGISQKLRDHFKSLQYNAEKIDELYSRWLNNLNSLKYLGRIFNTAITDKSKKDTGIVMGPSRPNFSLTARDQDCGINVANIHGIRVDAALFSSMSDEVDVDAFDESQAQTIEDAAKYFKAQAPDAEVTIEDRNIIIKKPGVLPWGEDEYTIPYNPEANYNLNLDEQMGLICVNTEDQIDVKALIGVLTQRMNNIKTSSLKAMALFKVLEADLDATPSSRQ